MKYSNKYNLPDVFVRAVVNDPYDNQGSDFTPSSLDDAPLAYALKKAYGDKLIVDVSSRVAAVIGQGAHSIAERAARPGLDLCEERLFSTFNIDGKDYKISAAIDLYEKDSGYLYDWKTTKAYAFSKKAGSGKKPSWIAQMNIGAELLRRHGHAPSKLTIIAMLKDWSAHEAGTAGCPEQEVTAVELPLWPSEQVVAYVTGRVRALTTATVKSDCSSKDNWGGRRCAQWCDASSVCPIYQESLKTGLIKKAEGE